MIEAVDLSNITLFGQDWGGLIGLRVAAENTERFARIVISNTDLPDIGHIAKGDFEKVNRAGHAYYDALPLSSNFLNMMMTRNLCT